MLLESKYMEIIHGLLPLLAVFGRDALELLILHNLPHLLCKFCKAFLHLYIILGDKLL